MAATNSTSSTDCEAVRSLLNAGFVNETVPAACCGWAPAGGGGGGSGAEAPGDYISCSQTTGAVTAVHITSAGVFPTAAQGILMSFSALKGLEELTLHNWYNVNRTLDINNIILFPSLKSLSLENLGLESISSGVGSTTLQYLSLRNNVISGALPSAIGNFINIVDVHVDNNNLYSSSNPFPVLNSLRNLTASHNSLSGQVPASLAVPNLTFLDLSSNSGLRGALPSSFQAIPTTHNLTINLNQTCVNTTGFSRPASSGAVTTIITANLTRQCSGNYDDYEGSHEFDGLLTVVILSAVIPTVVITACCWVGALLWNRSRRRAREARERVIANQARNPPSAPVWVPMDTLSDGGVPPTKR